MKLAEALVSRADMQKRLEQLRERLRLSALVQEGEQPPENPADLLAELERLIAELTALIPRINRYQPRQSEHDAARCPRPPRHARSAS